MPLPASSFRIIITFAVECRQYLSDIPVDTDTQCYSCEYTAKLNLSFKISVSSCQQLQSTQRVLCPAASSTS